MKDLKSVLAEVLPNLEAERDEAETLEELDEYTELIKSFLDSEDAKRGSL